jgi:DNA-binding transcriptional regulator YdaS (Cro superfamily)
LHFYGCRIAAMEPIKRAVEIAGGPAKLAAILGVTTQAVCFWRDGKRRLPAEQCAAIEQATGVLRRDLRPNDWREIWPELAEAEPGKVRELAPPDKPLDLVDRRVEAHPIAFDDRRRPSAEKAGA